MDTYLEKIDRNTERFTNTFGSLTADELNWKPDKNTWSIAQNMHHIIILNESYIRKIEELKSGKSHTPFLAKFDFILRFMGDSIGRYGSPDRKERTGTFDLWKPGNEPFDRSILEEFSDHQDRFKQVVRESEGLIETGAVIRSPATSLLFFKLDKALDFIISHEERHFVQTHEVFRKMRGLN